MSWGSWTVGELYLEARRLGLGRAGGGAPSADSGKQRILLNPQTKAKASGWTRMVGRWKRAAGEEKE